MPWGETDSNLTPGRKNGGLGKKHVDPFALKPFLSGIVALMGLGRKWSEFITSTLCVMGHITECVGNGERLCVGREGI